MKPFRLLFLTLALLLSSTSLASAEILALLNYESKPDQPVRREGIAIMDIDPESSDFGNILPVVHITNMFEATLWTGIWDPKAQSFSFNQVDDFGAREQGMPLEMLYNAKGDRLYVTTAKPGFVNLYDNTDPRQPKFLQAIPTAPGAHHSVLSPDERYLLHRGIGTLSGDRSLDKLLLFTYIHLRISSSTTFAICLG